jgi:hypothetical protein
MIKRFVFSVLTGALLFASGALAEYSKIEYTGDGTTHVYGATFTSGYMDKSTVRAHVYGEVDSNGDPAYRTITWPTASTVDIGAPPALGVAVTIERVTSSTVLKHTYANGSVITAKALNDSNKQHLYLHQELKDVVASIPEVDIQASVDAAAASAESAGASAAAIVVARDAAEDAATAAAASQGAATTAAGAATTQAGISTAAATVSADRFMVNGHNGAFQVFSAGVIGEIVGSSLPAPTGLAGVSTFEWLFTLSKTASGTATSVIKVHAGVTGDVGDAVIHTFTLPAGTAVADAGQVRIIMQIDSSGPAQTSVDALYSISTIHNLATTGLINAQCNVQEAAVAGNNFSASGLYFTLSITTGTDTQFTVGPILSRRHRIN